MIAFHKRYLLLLVAIPIFLVICALLYMFGMHMFEGQNRTFIESLEWASETLTTTGYGRDANWRHPAMVIFVILIQFLGVFLVFLVIPIYLIPILESRFEVKLPKLVQKIENHVVVYRYGPAVTSLIRELEQAQVKTVVIEPDHTIARQIHESGRRVVHCDLEDKALEAASLMTARALIVNGSDDLNAATILAARQMGFSREIMAMIENPLHRHPIMLAGATACYTPKHILGAALTFRASRRLNPRIAGIHKVGRYLEMAEVRISPDNPLAGKTLKEADIGRLTGVTVIAQWVNGVLDPTPKANMVLHPKGIVVAVGAGSGLEKLAELLGRGLPLPRTGPFLINGHGEVANKIAELLTAVGEEVHIMEPSSSDRDTEIVETEMLDRYNAREAQAIILAPASDSVTLFDTVVIKDYAPQVPVLARVNHNENLERTYLAGADFVLSISDISGQILARKLMGEESYAIGPTFKLKRTGVGNMVGTNPAGLEIRQQTGCSVVAVERGSQIINDLGGNFEFESQDILYICGSPEDLKKFENIFAA